VRTLQGFAHPDAREGNTAFMENASPSFHEICPITRFILSCNQSVEQDRKPVLPLSCEPGEISKVKMGSFPLETPGPPGKEMAGIARPFS